ncbi:MarR family transcriptional regulator [Nocardiopsis terrae]|uniref:DNA-binding MarR family transcriptional regulator n=1 Tax=Nocardiopsis terrae TaxID=372655 RepID=A0ABR9HMW6_9ACTN|nr:MarR family transcriptional regulator [Nocardiopsis terrae]MBE1460372.1 DNA-binding MarR family transcriptional regulator [Nocardiopsis terrae]GHC71105.1 MarR family transcriptional regulator [Nocardiopsis terrae]
MNDAVDLFLAQWARERPDLDTSPMGVVGRTNRLQQILGRGVSELLTEYDLERWEFDVLATLRRSGAPYQLTAKELVRMMMVGSAAMTNRVDRLVRRELVQRQADPASRRRVLVSLTGGGLDLVNRVVEGHVANEARLLEGLDTAERDQLAALMRKLLLSLGDTAPEEPRA